MKICFSIAFLSLFLAGFLYNSNNYRIVEQTSTLNGSGTVWVGEGNYLYVLLPYMGIEVWDLSHPANPTRVATCADTVNLNRSYWDYSSYAPGYSMVLHDHILYVANLGIWLVNVTDPIHPSQIGVVEGDKNATQIRVSDSNIFVGDYLLGLRIFNWTDKSNLSTFKYIGTYKPSKGYIRGLELVGSSVCIITSEYKLSILSVSKLGNVSIMGSLDYFPSTNNFIVQGTTLIVYSGYDLYMYDVAFPTSIQIRENFHVGYSYNYGSIGMYLDGMKLYIPYGIDFIILDMTDMNAIKFLTEKSSKLFYSTYSSSGQAIYAYEGYVYVLKHNNINTFQEDGPKTGPIYFWTFFGIGLVLLPIALKMRQMEKLEKSQTAEEKKIEYFIAGNFLCDFNISTLCVIFATGFEEIAIPIIFMSPVYFLVGYKLYTDLKNYKREIIAPHKKFDLFYAIAVLSFVFIISIAFSSYLMIAQSILTEVFLLVFVLLGLFISKKFSQFLEAQPLDHRTLVDLDHLPEKPIMKVMQFHKQQTAERQQTQSLTHIPSASSQTFIEKNNEIQPSHQDIELKVGISFEYNQHLFSILQKLGEGGMGAVYLARDQTNGQICAIKEFFTEKYWNRETGTNDCEEYWNKEQKILIIQGQSPVTSIKLIGALRDDKKNPPQYLLLMDYVYGTTLEYWIKATNIDMNTKIKSILIPLAKHLAFVHSNGIIHRDITPRNIMISEVNGIITPYLIDWGVAKELPVERMFSPKKPYFTSTTTAATSIASVGNPPEVLFGLNPIAASDIYMFGYVCIYVLMHGLIIPPQILLQPKIVLEGFLPGIPSSLIELIEQMLQFEPADRIANFAEIQSHLEKLF